MFRIWSMGNSTTADTMVVVPDSKNQYPIQKRFSDFSNTVFLWVLEGVLSLNINRSDPSFHHIHPLNKYQINTFHTIPGVRESIPGSPGHFHPNTLISTTKTQLHGRAYSHSTSCPDPTRYTSSDRHWGPWQLVPSRFLSISIWCPLIHHCKMMIYGARIPYLGIKWRELTTSRNLRESGVLKMTPLYQQCTLW